MMIGVLALAGCGVQFGSEEPGIVPLCPDLELETVPFADDTVATTAAATFGERSGTADVEGSGETDLTLTLSSTATEVDRWTLSREPTQDDRAAGCVDNIQFEAVLTVVTDDGAFDETITIRAMVEDEAPSTIHLDGVVPSSQVTGTWSPDLEAGELFRALDVLVEWTDTAASGTIDGRVEGEDDTSAWDRSAPGLSFALR